MNLANAAVDGDSRSNHEPADEQSFLDSIRRFSDYHLPCRGWYRVLEVGAGTGARAALLVERGYDVTIADTHSDALALMKHDFARRGLDATFLGIDDVAKAADAFDAVICFDASTLELAPALAAASLRTRVRRGGLLIPGPGFGGISARGWRRAGFKGDAAIGTTLSFVAARPLGTILARIARR
jgi:SAM-dependent methyltransferase